MNRFLGIASLVLSCGQLAAIAAAAGPCGPGSCTAEPGGCPSVASGYVIRQGTTMPGMRHHGCGPRHCGVRACDPCGHGGCRAGRCCHGACCRGPCGGCGHHGHCDTYDQRYFLRSQGKSWHSTWYDPAEGRPIALVVPPTAEFQTQYGWGVPSSRVAPIYHQFRRPYPGPGAVGGSGGGFLPTPNQPSDTVQFGVNAVRGPW